MLATINNTLHTGFLLPPVQSTLILLSAIKLPSCVQYKGEKGEENFIPLALNIFPGFHMFWFTHQRKYVYSR